MSEQIKKYSSMQHFARLNAQFIHSNAFRMEPRLQGGAGNADSFTFSLRDLIQSVKESDISSAVDCSTHHGKNNNGHKHRLVIASSRISRKEKRRGFKLHGHDKKRRDGDLSA